MRYFIGISIVLIGLAGAVWLLSPASQMASVEAVATSDPLITSSKPSDAPQGPPTYKIEDFAASGRMWKTNRNPAYFDNCDEARLAGVESISMGERGYDAHLDSDNDGIACGLSDD